jgi:hypothetical protein
LEDIARCDFCEQRVRESDIRISWILSPTISQVRQFNICPSCDKSPCEVTCKNCDHIGQSEDWIEKKTPYSILYRCPCCKSSDVIDNETIEIPCDLLSE